MPLQRSQQALDLLIQGAAVELMHSYGIPMAPRPAVELKTAPSLSNFTAVTVSFHTGKVAGYFAVALTTESLNALRKYFPATPSDRETLRELANQLLGGIRRRLLRYEINCSVGLPGSLDEAGLRQNLQRYGAARAYTFRSVRAELQLYMSNILNAHTLHYVGGHWAEVGSTELFE